MASLLRLITSNLVTRSFRPSVVSASRFLCIHRTYTTLPTSDFYDQSCPKIKSISFDMKMTASKRTLTLEVPAGWPKSKTDEDLKVTLNMPGVKKEDMKLQLKTSSDIKEDIRDGMLKDDIMAHFIANIVSSFRDITAKCSWLYYGVFLDRSILGKELCPVIGMLSPINSFKIFRKETVESLSLWMYMSRYKKMKLTRQGLLVSITINDHSDKVVVERKDVKTYFDYDTFFTEWKTKQKVHRIIGIHLPKGIHKKHNRIKRHMEDGVLYATIACSVKKE